MLENHIGTDPEVFLYHQGTGFIPSEGIIGGDKGMPRPVTPTGGVLEDNVTAEFNVSPAKTAKDITSYLWEAREALEAELNENGVGLVAAPYAEFHEDMLFGKALVIGCAADESAYGDKREAPSLREMGTTRFAGGHVHFEIGNKCTLHPVETIMVADALIGLWGVVKYNRTPRSKFYGLAGLFRHTPYGVEYRTPTNEWFASQEQTLEFFELAERVSTAVNSPTAKSLIKSLPVADIRHCIDAHDKEMALVLWNEINSEI